MIENYLQRHNFPKIKLKAILFDMDGVLFDSMKGHSYSWVRAMTEVGLPFTIERTYLFEGQPGVDTVNDVYKAVHGVEATEEQREEIYRLKSKYFEEQGEIDRIPFALELVNKLKEMGYILFVVTGSGQPTLLENLQNAFPGAFERERIISSFDVERGKPFPDPYLKALAKAGIEPWEAVVIENAPLGVQASNAAKIFTIGVNTGPLDRSVLLENGADIVFDSMQELYESWDNIGIQ